MSALERWRGRTPERTPADLFWEHQEIASLNNRGDGWQAVERMEIRAVVAYTAMGVGTEVYRAAAAFSMRTPEAGDFFQRVADQWADATERDVAYLYQRRS